MKWTWTLFEHYFCYFVIQDGKSVELLCSFDVVHMSRLEVFQRHHPEVSKEEVTPPEVSQEEVTAPDVSDTQVCSMFKLRSKYVQ